MSRDPLDEMAARDAGVRELLNALVSAPSEDELAREQVALAMFSAFNPARAEVQAPGRARAPRSHRKQVRSVRFGVRLATAATVVTLVSGFTVASYAAALPAPLQRLAHQFLGYLGVPDAVGPLPRVHASPSVPASKATGGSRHHQLRTGSPAPGRGHSQPASPSPRPSRHPHHRQPARPAPHHHGGLTLSPLAHRVQAGGSVRFTATLDKHGRPQPNVRLSLLILPTWPPHGQWRPIEPMVTNSQGQASFTVPFLWTNVSFEVTGPGSVHSRKVTIVVIPQVFARILPGGRHGHGDDRPFVLVGCRGAAPGDTAKLEVRGHGGHWRVVGTSQFHRDGLAVFPIDASQVNRTYRAVVLATKLHGRALSKTFSGETDDQRHRGYHWTPPPTPSPTPFPSRT